MKKNTKIIVAVVVIVLMVAVGCIYGFVLKAKGCKYKKNVIIGIIMTILLCIYGSFSFIF